MIDRWDAAEAEALVLEYGERGISEAVALRVYTSRLIGRDPRLVLHGGGNTSVKTTEAAVDGSPVPVLRIKGSGWDLAGLEPEGLPAVRLEPLRALRSLDELPDEAMVSEHRRNLLDAAAPNPSVETLLHAFLPHRFVDHTHAEAVLALTDQPRAEALVQEVYGDRVAVVPYVMPGFHLAKAAAAAFEEAPGCEGMILLKHGIFSFGESAEASYRRMIELVTLAEGRLAAAGASVASGPRDGGGESGPAPPAAADLAPALRGLLSSPASTDAEPRRVVLEFRTSEKIRTRLRGVRVEEHPFRGPVTPDHVLRTGPWPLVVPPTADVASFREGTAAAVSAYRRRYEAYYARHRGDRKLTMRDPSPRVVLVPGLGLFGAGRSAAEAGASADLAEATLRVVGDAERLGRFEPIGEAEIFDIEYWSLEQAKLAGRSSRPLDGHVVVVTGGAGTIGRATAAAFRTLGAELVLLDLESAGPADTASELGAVGIICDVTDRPSVEAAFAEICERLGGMDVVVSNAGAAWQGRIGEVSDAILRRSFELNFFGHQNVARTAVGVFRRQGTGGVLLFNASKQAVNPGRDFGPYGLPKAATLALMRQYAVDYGGEGIRANAVNADRIRSGLLTDEMVAERAAARGVDPETYMAGNLLRREVRAVDVARAFVSLALSTRTTAAVLPVDGGNVAAALR